MSYYVPCIAMQMIDSGHTVQCRTSLSIVNLVPLKLASPLIPQHVGMQLQPIRSLHPQLLKLPKPNLSRTLDLLPGTLGMIRIVDEESSVLSVD